VVVTVEGEPAVQVITPTPEPQEPRTLVVCLGREPDSLYPYGTNMAESLSVLEAVYDGPFDERGFVAHPVILEKIPTLGGGDVTIQPVPVSLGDTIVDADSNLTTLESGTLVRPSGCNAQDCVFAYDTTTSLQLDQMTVRFNLLSGLTWSDGTPLTAQDSVYSYALASDPETPGSKFKTDRTAGYEALSDLTVQWTGIPGFLDALFFANFWTPLPEHAWGSLSPGELLTADAAAKTPLGYGPYVIDEWVAGESIRLHKNENYYRSPEGLPKLENLVFRFVGLDTNTNIAQLLSGECDILDRTTRLDDQGVLLQALSEQGQLNFSMITNLDWEHAAFGIVPVSYTDGFNPLLDRPDLFGDVRTRQAIAMCMDRQAVIDEALMGRSLVPDSYLPPDHPVFNAAITQYEYNVEAGAALLAEVGWIDHDGDPLTPRLAQGVLNVPNGTPLDFTYLATESSQRKRAAEIIVESMTPCGIRANLSSLPAGELYDSGPEGPLFGRNFDMGQFAWRIGFDPACFLYLSEAIPGDPALEDEEGNRRFILGWGGWNLTGYSSAEYDAICKNARTALPGQEAYRANHFAAQEIFANDLPVVPLYMQLSMAATRPDLCHFVMDSTADSDLWNIEEIDYGESCAKAQ
jgi:peptide/nickel transport system substrate-binding protein